MKPPKAKRSQSEPPPSSKKNKNGGKDGTKGGGRKSKGKGKGKDKDANKEPKLPKISVTYCFSFYKGKCAKGDDCKFPHMSQQEVKAQQEVDTAAGWKPGQ